MTNLDSILKSRDATLPTKVHLVKAMVFPVVMYGCESWTIKKAECWRIDALNCGAGEDSWESLRLQGNPTSPSWRRSVLGVHGRTDVEAETPILWPPPMRRADSFEKTLMLGKIEGRRRRGWHRMRWLDDITDSMDVGFGWTPGVGDGQGGLVCYSSWSCKEWDMTEWLNWTETMFYRYKETFPFMLIMT